MKANSKFDYIIVGGGLSGLHLSYCFLKDKYFKDYSILIIDKGKPKKQDNYCLLYTSPSPRDAHESRMPSSA